MQRTTNYNLKKPERVEASLIDDINDNMDTIDEKLHDTKNSVVAFTSSDVADGSATAWTTVTKLATGEKHSSLFAKMSQMFKNIRYLYKLLGTKDISSIGDGTVTGGLTSLNDSLKFDQNATGIRFSSGGSDSFSMNLYKDGQTYHSLFFGNNRAHWRYTANGAITTPWQSLYLESTTAVASGTNKTNHTLTHNLRDYTAREIVGVCNGGSTNNAVILNIIPTGPTTVQVTWSQALPSTGSVRVTFIYL